MGTVQHDVAQMSNGVSGRGDPLELAGLRARAASGALDLVLIGVGLAMALGIRFSLGVTEANGSDAAAADASGLIFAWLAIAIVGIAACWCTLGASPGGMLLGCRVVDASDRSRIRCRRALLRVLGLILALAPLGLGWLAAVRHPQRRGWHDRLAGTVVVIEDESRSSLDDWLEHWP